MFDKKRFSDILQKIQSLYESQTEFAKKSGLNRTYISKYSHCTLNKPPKPATLYKIANSSKGTTSYFELMSICDYVKATDIFNSSFPSLYIINKQQLKKFGLSTYDIDEIERLSKSKIKNKDELISKIIERYPIEVQDNVYNMFISQKINISEDKEFLENISKKLKLLSKLNLHDLDEKDIEDMNNYADYLRHKK